MSATDHNTGVNDIYSLGGEKRQNPEEAIEASNCILSRVCVYVCATPLNHVQLFVTSWIAAHPPGSSVHGIFQARILECTAIFLLQGFFPTQGSNLCLRHLLHWQMDSLPLCYLGSPGTEYTQVQRVYSGIQTFPII